MKTCNTCGETKDKSQFHRNARRPDLRDGKCKACCAIYAVAQRRRYLESPEWAAKEADRLMKSARKRRAEGTAYVQTLEESKVAVAKYRGKYPERHKARYTLNNALRTGKIKRGRCFCGEIGEAHHFDYSRPLEGVMWLCKPHHHEQHVKERREKVLAKSKTP